MGVGTPIHFVLFLADEDGGWRMEGGWEGGRRVCLRGLPPRWGGEGHCDLELFGEVRFPATAGHNPRLAVRRVVWYPQSNCELGGDPTGTCGPSTGLRTGLGRPGAACGKTPVKPVLLFGAARPIPFTQPFFLPPPQSVLAAGQVGFCCFWPDQMWFD